MPNRTTKTETGKHGLWDTRPNPFGSKAPQANTASYAEIPSFGLAVDKILRAGCAVLLGQTRDGGALVLTILDGEERHRTYCSNQSDLDKAITSIDFAYTPD
jgi:hypothetical protein